MIFMSDLKDDAAALKIQSQQIVLQGSTEITPRHGPSGVGIAATQWSVNLLFTETHQQGPLGLINSGSVSVEIPWALAKALKLLLEDTIQKYEATEGTIHLPNSFKIG